MFANSINLISTRGGLLDDLEKYLAFGLYENSLVIGIVSDLTIPTFDKNTTFLGFLQAFKALENVITVDDDSTVK